MTPVQTFYFPAGTFDTLTPFIGTLEALENAFIGAYLAAIREFARMAAVAGSGSDFTSGELSYFSQVSAAIMGIECEHRVLGRDIESATPANNRNYEAVDGIHSVFNGSHSAVVALTSVSYFFNWTSFLFRGCSRERLVSMAQDWRRSAATINNYFHRRGHLV